MNKRKLIFSTYEVIHRIIDYLFCFCFSIFTLLAFKSNAQEITWAKAVSSPDFEYGVDADLDSHGNIFIIGHGTGFTLNIDSVTYNGNGEGDVFIAKLTSNKQLLWFKTLGGDDNIYSDAAMDIHVDNNDDVLILVKSVGNNFTYDGDTLSGINSMGQYSGEGVIIKIDNNGNYLWHDDGSVSSSFQNVTTDLSGNIYLTGWFRSSITLADTLQLTNTTFGTTLDMFVAKYSSAGELLWAKNVGGTVHNSIATGENIQIDEPSGKIVVLGTFSKDIYFETGVLSTSLPRATFLVTYDLNGTELWKKIVFSNYDSFSHGLDISSNGLIGIVGYFLGNYPDGLVGFYDLSGNVLSEEVYSSPNYCRLYSLEFNHLNECYITGEFRNSLSLGLALNNISINANYNYSGFILKLDSSQIPDWVIQKSALFLNKVTCKNNRILYSCRIDDSFIYNFGEDTITNNSGDAIFAEISDTTCAVIQITNTVTACGSYIWIDGNTYTSSNDTATLLIVGGAFSCDTLITLNLTINNSNTSSITATACNSYISPSGKIWNVSDTYMDTILNAAGCDSIITIDLTINTVNTSVTQNGITLTANASGASYKWLDCNNENSMIVGETSQSYTAIQNGNYAVEVTQNTCIDTSLCFSVTTVGALGNTFSNNIVAYPNPANDVITIDLGETLKNFSVIIADLSGKEIVQSKFDNTDSFQENLNIQPGIYLLKINSESKVATIRFIKN